MLNNNKFMINKLNITLRNSLTGQIMPLSQDTKSKSMYVCGPTVYDLIHIGNARTFLVFDILYRIMRYLYGDVTYVRNITDVDDKIIKKSAEQSISIEKLTQQTINDFRKDMLDFRLCAPTHEPKASEYILPMQHFIQTLLDAGIAYQIENGILYDTSQFPLYSFLSHRDMDNNVIHRIDAEDILGKKNHHDFYLWKCINIPINDSVNSISNNINIYGWQSPWGFGIPGWHIECTVMRQKYISQHCDVHGGGVDLFFPHHTNDIAQSYALDALVDNVTNLEKRIKEEIWMHVSTLNTQQVKMSKSLNNIISLREAIQKHGPNVIKLAMLNSHYSQIIDWNDNTIHQARIFLSQIKYAARHHITNHEYQINNDFRNKKLHLPCLVALCNNLNTYEFMVELRQLVNDILDNKITDISILLNTCEFVGLHITAPLPPTPIISQLLEQRKIMRINKNYHEADKIRDILLQEHNVVVYDKPNGEYHWHYTNAD